jgi:membrane fusion protein, multidrug efflux system
MKSSMERVMSDLMKFETRVLVATMIVMLILVSGCDHQVENEAHIETARNVRVVEMQTTDLVEFFEISGPLRPVRGTDVSAEEMGAVYAIPHDKGARVSAGDVIVELDRRILEADMASAGHNLKLQSHTAENTAALFEAGKVSQTELLGARAAEAQAEAMYEVAVLRYRRAAIKAPFDGVFVDRHVELGQLVSPGQPVGRVIDPYVLKLAGSVSEREVAWLRVDAPATVVLEGMDRSVTGRVAWMGFEADPVTGKFKVEVHVDNADLALRSGVVARARIHKITHEDVLVVPRDAVMYTVDGQVVYLVDGDRARRREVVPGPDQGLMIVIEDGLAAGDRLVVRGHRDLVDGALVDVTEESASRDGSDGDDPGEVLEAASIGAEEAAR